MRIYQVQATGDPYPWPYTLGLYATADEADAIDEAKAEHPEIAALDNVGFVAVRAIGIGE